MSLCDDCRRLLASLFTLCWMSVVNEHHVFWRDAARIYEHSRPRDTGWQAYKGIFDDSPEGQLPRGKSVDDITRSVRYSPFQASCTIDLEGSLRNCGSCWFCSKICIVFDTHFAQINQKSSIEAPEGAVPGNRSASSVALEATFDQSFSPEGEGQHLTLTIENNLFPLEFELFTRCGSPIGHSKYIGGGKFKPRPSGTSRIARYITSSEPTELGLRITDRIESIPASSLGVSASLTTTDEQNVDPTTEKRIEMARRWLYTCDTSHASCRSLFENKRFKHTDLPRRILRIEEDGESFQLVETSTIADVDLSYVTLSHCWGQKKFLSLTQSNLEDFKRGKSVAEVAMTFRHAFLLARMLDFRYIWIDCFCIIQDSPEDADWKLEATRMHIVYGNSALTIAATGSRSASDGLFHPPSLGLSTRGSIELPDNFQMYSSDEEARMLTARELERSSLLQRGWVQQEMAMSKRVLHWTRGQLIWQCDAIDQAETLGPVIFQEGNVLTIWSKIRKDATDPIEIAERWSAVARTYAPTRVTRAEDRYYAILSLAVQTHQAFQRAGIQTAYAAGVWKHDLFRWIAWHRPQRFEQLHEMSSLSTSPNRELFLPSWSWLRSTDPVVFPALPDPEDLVFRRSHGHKWHPCAELVSTSMDHENGSRVTGALEFTTLRMRTLTFENPDGFEIDFEKMDRVGGTRAADGSDFVSCYEADTPRSEKDDGFCRLVWTFDSDDGTASQATPYLKYALLGKESHNLWSCIYALILEQTRDSTPHVEYRRIGLFSMRSNKFGPWPERASYWQVHERARKHLQLTNAREEEFLLR